MHLPRSHALTCTNAVSMYNKSRRLAGRGGGEGSRDRMGWDGMGWGWMGLDGAVRGCTGVECCRGWFRAVGFGEENG